ncbi:MAG: sterol desaturase family protein [Syntrophobacterales bacterium]|nr:sterol desaturase family protein [Syntrophobacterales bacterium]
MIFPDINFQLYFPQNEAAIRIGCFLFLFIVIAIAETLAPRRPLIVKKPLRWFGNISIHLVNGLLPRLLFPILPVGMALLWARKGWGLLNIVPLPETVSILLGILALDLLIYVQHVLFHRVPLFWRLHRMHHTDLDLDLTSALRFHPLEIVLSLLIKMAAVALLGPPALAVILFEIILNGMAMFNHGNFRIPARLDSLLRRIVVTPDMHLVHHSSLRKEANHNFGFNLSWWDRLFGTYQAEPAAGREGMVIGLTGFLDVRYARFWKMILNPLEKGGRAWR